LKVISRFFQLLIITVTIFGIAPIGKASAQRRKTQFSVEQTLDQKKVRLGEEVKLEIYIMASNLSRKANVRSKFFTNFKPPNFKEFTVVDKSESSQRSINIYNGVYHQGFSYTIVYFLRPIKQGVLTLSPASVLINGKRYSSSSLYLNVTAAREIPKPILDGKTPDSSNAGDQFIQTFISSNRVYVGQPLVVSWYSYTFSPLTEAPRSDLPDAPGFFNKSLLKGQKSYDVNRVSVGNETYIRYLLYRRIYWPQRSGKLLIGSRAISLYTRNTLLASTKTLVRSSAPVELKVLPLPVKRKPANFNEDNVGRFKVKCDLATTSIKTNEAIDLSITIYGEGLLTSAKISKLPTVNWARLELNGSPVVTEKIVKKRSIYGTRKIKYILIPTKPGNHTFPPIEFQYFDPIGKRYRFAKTKSVKINVLPSRSNPLSVNMRAPSNKSTNAISKENILAPKIKPISLSTVSSSSVRASFSSGFIFWLLLILPPLISILILISLIVIKARNRDHEGKKKRELKVRRKQGLILSKEFCSKGKASDLYGELTKLITDAISYSTGCSAHGLTNEELMGELRTADASTVLIETILENLESFDFARYSPSISKEKSELNNSLDITKKLMAKIDKLKSREV
jgi:BatD DUF11 like domain